MRTDTAGYGSGGGVGNGVAGAGRGPDAPPDRTPAQGRRVHLVDVENLVGGGRLTSADVAACFDAYVGLGLVGPDDHVIVGCSPMVQLEVGLGWGGPHRRVVGHGPDGADLALLDVVRTEALDARFTEVVVASGDHAFADAVARLRADGVAVTVVSRPDALSWRLYAVAGADPVRFPDLDTTFDLALEADDGPGFLRGDDLASVSLACSVELAPSEDLEMAFAA